jgi:hypothetical protein
MALAGLLAANNLNDVTNIERTWDNIGSNISATVFVPSPTLDLNFAANKSLVDSISGNNLITFDRASTGTFVGSDGLVQTAASGVPRFDHNPATGESLGLLVEEARTNLLVHSQTSTGWGGTTMLNSAGTAPDGTNTAMLATDNSGNRSTLGAGTFTYSFFVKQGTSSTVRLIWAGYGGTDWTFTFSTQSLVVSGAWSNASVVRYPNSWYRISATTSSRDSYYYLLYADSASSTFNLWGCQGEAGSFPTSYIPTTSSTVTRAADIASVTGTNFSNWFNAAQGSFVSDSIWNGTSLYGNPFIWAVDNTNITQRYAFYSPSNTTRILYTSSSAGTTQAAAPSNSSSKVAFNYSANQQTTFRGGFVGGSTTNIYPTGLNRFTFSPNQFASSASPGSIHHARLTYYPVSLSDVTLKALTTYGVVSSFLYSFSIKGRDILALKQVNKASTRDFILIKGLSSKVQPRITTSSQYTSSGVALRNVAMLRNAPTTSGNYFFSSGLTLSGATCQINGTPACSIATSPFSSSTAIVPLLFAGLRPQANWLITEPMASGTISSPESAIPIEANDFLLFMKAGQS